MNAVSIALGLTVGLPRRGSCHGEAVTEREPKGNEARTDTAAAPSVIDQRV